MQAFQIDSYQIGMWTHFPDGPYRYIWLRTDQPTDGIDGAVLMFPRGGQNYDSIIGPHVHVTLQWDEYEPIYHVLQTESPCYFLWDVTAAGSFRLSHIGTSAEPLGEGLRDVSP